MRSFATFSLAALLYLAVPAGAVAQTTTTSPAPPTVAEPLQLFPVEARFAYIDFQRIASDSTTGKLALRILQELRDRKVAEIEGRSKQLQTLKSPREIDRLQREIQFAEQNAQVEIEQLKTELLTNFHKQVTPVVAGIAKEKKLLAVFSAESNLFYVDPAIDLSAEVIKRLDAAERTPR
jgi:Skp family chaperone for outer membrane proteins